MVHLLFSLIINLKSKHTVLIFCFFHLLRSNTTIHQPYDSAAIPQYFNERQLAGHCSLLDERIAMNPIRENSRVGKTADARSFWTAWMMPTRKPWQIYISSVRPSGSRVLLQSCGQRYLQKGEPSPRKPAAVPMYCRRLLFWKLKTVK